MWTPDDNTGEAQASAGLMTTPPAAEPMGPADYRETATARQDAPPQLFGMHPQEFAPAMLSAFQDPEAMVKLGEIAVKYQQPQFLDYLKRGYDAQKENAGTAVMKLIAGDTQGALQAFNASGQHKADSITPNGDGTYNVNLTGPDGKAYVRSINPQKEMLSFLTPPQFMAHNDREAALNAKATALDAHGREIDARITSSEKIADAKRQMDGKLAEIMDRYQSDKISLGEMGARDKRDYQMGLLQAQMDKIGLAGANLGLQRDLLQSKVDLNDARSASLDGKASGNVGNWNVINSQIATAAKLNDYAMVQDKNDMTKKRLDAGRANTLASIAQKLARDDPATYASSPAATVEAAVAKLKVIDQQVGDQVDTAVKMRSDTAGLYISKDDWQNAKVLVDGKPQIIKATGLTDFKSKAAEVLTKAALAKEGLGPSGLPDKTTGTTSASGTIRTPVATPQVATPYPEGTPLTKRNPATGRAENYVVRGGKPVLVQ